MPHRRPPGLLAALLLVLLLAATPAQGALPAGFRPAPDGATGPFALHGSSLVWLGSDRFLHRTDLATGTTSSLTFIPVGARVQSLAFDGAWVAWCDDRFGNLEAFAMDLHSLELKRLSKDLGADADIAVGGGHVAWLRDGVLLGTDLPSLSVRRLSLLPGLAFSPSLDGDLLAWSQVVGGERHLAGLRWGGNATVLTAAPNSVEGNPVVADGRVTWLVEAFSGTLGNRGTRPLGAQVLVADFTSIAPLKAHNLTARGAHGQPKMGGAWVAWLEGKGSNGLSAVNLETGEKFQVLVGLNDILVSGTHLLVVPSDGAPQIRPWAGAHQTGSLDVVAPLLALAACALRRAPGIRRPVA